MKEIRIYNIVIIGHDYSDEEAVQIINLELGKDTARVIDPATNLYWTNLSWYTATSQKTT